LVEDPVERSAARIREINRHRAVHLYDLADRFGPPLERRRKAKAKEKLKEKKVKKKDE